MKDLIELERFVEFDRFKKLQIELSCDVGLDLLSVLFSKIEKRKHVQARFGPGEV